MMKKRALALLLALTLMMTVTACGKKQETAPEDEDMQIEETQKPEEQTDEEAEESEEADAPAELPEEEASQEETEAKPESKPEEKPAAKPESKPEQKPAAKPESKPEQKPAAKPESKPEQKPAAKPETKPEQKPAAQSADLSAFYQDTIVGTIFADKYGADGPMMMEMDAELMENYYPGLSGIATKQCVVYQAAISAAVAEFVLVEVENSGDVQKVKDILQARIDTQVGTDTNPGGAMYPATVEGWKNDSRVVSNGNLVMLVAIDCADDVVAAFNKL